MRASVTPDARRPSCPPTALSVRPLRRRVGHPRAAALVGRKARPPAEVAAGSTGSRRRVLPAQERVFVADAAPRVPALADGLLPLLPQVEDRRPAAPSPRPSSRGGARCVRTRPGSQRCGDRQPGGEDDDPGRRTGTRLRRSEASGRTEAPHLGGHGRAGVGREGSRRRPTRSGRRETIALEDGKELPTEDGAGLGGRGLHGRVARVVAAPAGVAPGSVPPHPDRRLWRYGLEEKPRVACRCYLAVGSWSGPSRG